MKAARTSSRTMPPDCAATVPAGPTADVVGTLLLAGCAGWALVTSGGRDAHPEGVLLGLLAVAAGYAAGRIAGAVTPVGAPAAVALAVAVLTPLVPGALTGELTAPPLHELDANGALLALAAGAACCAAQAAAAGLRPALAALACGLTAEAVATGSTTGILACAATLAVAAAVHSARRRVPILVALALCAALAAAAPLLSARPEDPGTVSAATAPPSEQQAFEQQTGGADRPTQRAALWHDALAEAAGDPVRGVGPGLFAELSPTAQGSSAPGSASSAPLQAAAEQGVPGLCLLAASYAWMLWTLRRSPATTRVVLTAGGALTTLAMEAAVGPVLSYPAITAGAGLLVGMAAARPLPKQGPDTPEARGKDQGRLV